MSMQDFCRAESEDAVMTLTGAMLALGRRFNIEDLVTTLNHESALEEVEAALAEHAPAGAPLQKLRLWLDRFRVPSDPSGENPGEKRIDMHRLKHNIGWTSSGVIASSSGNFLFVVRP